ncbi:hypothetical protein KR009_011611 [Drosophila setifemur]|nr:hypothetical protein KR009_011611 [Drosophila setifemur]
MPPKPKHRDVAPFLNRIRDFFLGRTHQTAHRFADTVSPRTQPPPDIPSGSLDSLQANYYSRDPRGVVKPPVDLVEEQKQLLLAKTKAEEAAKAAKNAPAKPGDTPKPPPQPTETKKEEPSPGQMKQLPTPGKMHSWEGPD